jgi:hypothetical protein
MLDLLIRASYFFLTSLNVLLIPIALFLSVLHLVALILISYSVLDFDLRACTAAAVTVSTTNTVFCGVVIFLWLADIRSGSQTVCVQYECYWINGSVTWLGARQIGLQVLAQVVINVLSVFIVYAFSANRAARLQ